MNPLVMSDAQLQAVARVPNVAAVQPKSVFSSRVYVGARRQKAVLIAVPDYTRQNTDAITVKSGSAPSAGTVLTDRQNASKDGTTPAAWVLRCASSRATARSRRCA